MSKLNWPSPSQGRCDVNVDGGKLVFRFADDTKVTPGRHVFGDRRELVNYLSECFSLPRQGEGLRGSTVRHGKYQRVDEEGNGIFTFGDPILDLITDRHGHLMLAGERLRLAPIELSDPRYRGGGLSNINLADHLEDILKSQLRAAARGEGDFSLVQCDKNVVAFASKNPSKRDFYVGGDHMRFRAWKKNYILYWSMGAEIETQKADFTSAQIKSDYFDIVLGGVCAVVKSDSDSDTNDDYVDEYEWGINAPQPTRVVSLCSAQWKGQRFSDYVEAGPPCYELGGSVFGLTINA